MEAKLSEDGLWTNVTKGQLAECHQDMNADAFEDNLRELCRRLGKGAVLIMDNAPYHTRKLFSMPTGSVPVSGCD
jgi:hypothetical protein